MSDDTVKPIVVGVDGSPSSLAALEWAARQARLTGAPLQAVTTWEWPRSYGYPMPLATDFDPAADATKVLEEALAPVRSRHPDLQLETAVVEGPAAHVLVERSAESALLVIGCRGHGEFAGMLLGSVSERCVAHAHCPVLVLRH